MSLVSPVLLWMISVSPAIALVAAIAAVVTGERRYAQGAVGAFAAGLALSWGLGLAYAALALVHDEPNERVALLAGGLAEAMNTSCVATLGLPSAAVGLWVMRRSAEAPPAR